MISTVSAASLPMKLTAGSMFLRRGPPRPNELTSPVHWFDSYAEYTQQNPVPVARMHGIVVDEANRAWVLVTVPDPEFRMKPSYEADSQGLSPPSRTHAAYNSVIEVWDLDTGKLLTGIRASPSLRAFADNRHVYGYIETTAGEIRARVWRLELKDPATQ